MNRCRYVSPRAVSDRESRRVTLNEASGGRVNFSQREYMQREGNEKSEGDLYVVFLVPVIARAHLHMPTFSLYLLIYLSLYHCLPCPRSSVHA